MALWNQEASAALHSFTRIPTSQSGVWSSHLSYWCVKCDITHTGVIAVGMLHTLGTWGKTSQVFREKHNMPHCLHQRLGTQFGSAVDLPLCLARYLPRTMIRHKVTKTTTATTPPIKAWSVPCCPKAFGSEEGRRERTRGGEVRRSAMGWSEGRGAAEGSGREKTERGGSTICRSFLL